MGARGLCLAALLLLLLLCWAGPAEGKAAKKTKHPHNREDVPFVRCVVCQEVAKVLARDIKQMKSEKKKVLPLSLHVHYDAFRLLPARREREIDAVEAYRWTAVAFFTARRTTAPLYKHLSSPAVRAGERDRYSGQD